MNPAKGMGCINESVRWEEGEQPGEKMAMKIIFVEGKKIEKRDREIAGKMGGKGDVVDAGKQC